MGELADVASKSYSVLSEAPLLINQSPMGFNSESV